MVRLTACIALLLAVSGCDALEQYQSNVSWHPTGASASNLAAEVVDPADLLRGRAPGPTDGTEAAMPIDRLRHDHVKPLPDPNNGSSSGGATPAASLTGN